MSEYSFCTDATRGAPSASARSIQRVVPQQLSFDRPKARTFPSATISDIAVSTSSIWASVRSRFWDEGSKLQFWRNI